MTEEKKKIFFRGVEIIYEENLGERDDEQYLGTEEQKIAIEKAMREAGLIDGNPAPGPQHP